MIIWLCQWLVGFLEIQVQGSSPERFFNMCAHHHMKIWNLKSREDYFVLYISKKDFKSLRPLIRKTKIKIKILKRHGLPFLIFRHRNKKLFLVVLLVLGGALYWTSNLIWDIEVNGNIYYTDEAIVSYLNQNDIEKFMKIESVNGNEIELMLRDEYEYIIWVTVYVEGRSLIVNVKENEQMTYETENTGNELPVENTIDEIQGQDIVAQVDGIVASIITRKGTPLVHQGDLVEAGDILVSGCLEIMGDYDVLVGYVYVEADADIGIITTYSYSDEINLAYQRKVYSEENDKSVYIKFSSYYCMLNLTSRLDTLYDSTEIELTLSPSKQQILQLSVGMITNHSYTYETAYYSETEAQEILSQHYQQYCEELIEKGVEILGNDVKIYIDDKTAQAKGALEVIVSNVEKQATEIRELPEVVEEGNDE